MITIADIEVWLVSWDRALCLGDLAAATAMLDTTFAQYSELGGRHLVDPNMRERFLEERAAQHQAGQPNWRLQVQRVTPIGAHLAVAEVVLDRPGREPTPVVWFFRRSGATYRLSVEVAPSDIGPNTDALPAWAMDQTGIDDEFPHAPTVPGPDGPVCALDDGELAEHIRARSERKRAAQIEGDAERFLGYFVIPGGILCEAGHWAMSTHAEQREHVAHAAAISVSEGVISMSRVVERLVRLGPNLAVIQTWRRAVNERGQIAQTQSRPWSVMHLHQGQWRVSLTVVELLDRPGSLPMLCISMRHAIEEDLLTYLHRDQPGGIRSLGFRRVTIDG